MSILSQLMISQADGNRSIIAASRAQKSEQGRQRKGSSVRAQSSQGRQCWWHGSCSFQSLSQHLPGEQTTCCPLLWWAPGCLLYKNTQHNPVSVLCGKVVLVYRLTIPFRQAPLKSLSRMKKNKYLVGSLQCFLLFCWTLLFHHQSQLEFTVNILWN